MKGHKYAMLRIDSVLNFRKRAQGAWLALMILGTLLAAGAAPAAAAETKVVTDMAGRKVTVPATVKKAFGLNPPSTILIFALAPDKLAGWNFPYTPQSREFIAKKYLTLPALGGAGMPLNPEVIAKAKPDVIVAMALNKMDPMFISQAEKIAKQTGIPVVTLNSDLEHYGEACLFLGELLEAPREAQNLAVFCRNALDETREKLKDVPAGKRPHFYYAEGKDGLMTDPAGSYHQAVLELSGGVNVAKVPAQRGTSLTPISMEQALGWNPDWIILGSASGVAPRAIFMKESMSGAWKNVNALQTGRVYTVPLYPYNWVDRPPALNRFIGIYWAASLFHPDLFPPAALPGKIRAFYRMVYHVEVSDAQIDRLLTGALPDGSWKK